MSSRVGRPSGPTPKCIFCGGVGLTKEHVFPEWMGKHFPRGAHAKRVEEAGRFDERMTHLGTTSDIRHGHIVSKTVKTVCRRCNNGWMNGVEDAAKIVFEPLMYGNSAIIGEDEKRRISEWAILKCLILESDKNVQRVMTNEHRKTFLEKRSIPNWTYIDIFAHLDDKWTSAVYRHATGFVEEGKEQGFTSRNVQVFMIGVGRLLVHVFQTLTRPYEPTFHNGVAHRVWPLGGDQIIWPPLNVLGTGGPDSVAGLLGDHLRTLVPPR